MIDVLNLPNKEGQNSQNAILQQIANTLGVTTDALNSAVNLANTAGNNANAKIIDIENRFQQLTATQQQSAEVIDARGNAASLGGRLDGIDARLAQTATKEDVSKLEEHEQQISQLSEQTAFHDLDNNKKYIITLRTQNRIPQLSYTEVIEE